MMNKLLNIIIVCILCLVSTITRAQYVVDVQHQPDGSRLIITKSKQFVIGEAYYSIYVEALKQKDSTIWFMCFSSFESIDANAEVLIKLENDELVFSNVNSVYVGGVMTPGVSYSLGNVAIHYPSTKENYYSSFFVITEKQMKSMIDNKIVKIRLYTGKYYDEAVLKSNRLRKLLTCSYKNINDHLGKNPDTKSIFDDF